MKYLAAILVIVFVAGMTHGQFINPANDMPAFHAAPPAKGQALPPILNQAQLAESGFTQPAQKESYKAAAKVGNVLYQEPCYCHCDRAHGHTSLRSCFETTHGAACGTCMAEALYSYQMSKKGWTAKAIRDGIIRGDFKTVDLQNPAPVN
jgi:Protein of unknown function with PCYCGC motif